ncbi:hypothetical protein QBC45DRAFT_63618 [Copromyces sp. CBS 386.78]|nr:hypothetical protein QBC45DRAFT_63618 [Copromyces sp. CBS 386.78]
MMRLSPTLQYLSLPRPSFHPSLHTTARYLNWVRGSLRWRGRHTPSLLVDGDRNAYVGLSWHSVCSTQPNPFPILNGKMRLRYWCWRQKRFKFFFGKISPLRKRPREGRTVEGTTELHTYLPVWIGRYRHRSGGVVQLSSRGNSHHRGTVHLRTPSLPLGFETWVSASFSAFCCPHLQSSPMTPRPLNYILPNSVKRPRPRAPHLHRPRQLHEVVPHEEN